MRSWCWNKSIWCEWERSSFARLVTRVTRRPMSWATISSCADWTMKRPTAFSLAWRQTFHNRTLLPLRTCRGMKAARADCSSCFQCDWIKWSGWRTWRLGAIASGGCFHSRHPGHHRDHQARQDHRLRLVVDLRALAIGRSDLQLNSDSSETLFRCLWWLFHGCWFRLCCYLKCQLVLDRLKFK